MSRDWIKPISDLGFLSKLKKVLKSIETLPGSMMWAGREKEIKRSSARKERRQE